MLWHKNRVRSESVNSSVVSDSCDPVDCSPPGFFVAGIPLSMGFFQAKILEWVSILFSMGSSWPRDQTWVSCTVDRFFTIWATSILAWRIVWRIPGTEEPGRLQSLGSKRERSELLTSWIHIRKHCWSCTDSDPWDFLICWGSFPHPLCSSVSNDTIQTNKWAEL